MKDPQTYYRYWQCRILESKIQRKTTTMCRSKLLHAYVCSFIWLMAGCSTSGDNISLLFEDMEGPRSKILLDENWKFNLGDPDGAEAPGYNDSSWRILDLPHDWSIEDILGTDSPIDSSAIGGISTGYFVGGTGWYRKEFELPESISGKTFYLQFDGIYMDADVWINGVHLGNHPYGYTSFRFNISDKLLFGEKNLVAVRVCNEGRNSRWYSGSGIYRHVWLTAAEPVHVVPWGTRITTPEIENGRVVVEIENTVITGTGGSYRLVTEILNSSGEVVQSKKEELENKGKVTLQVVQRMDIPSPQLWSVESPILYSAVTSILDENSIPVDRVETRFGIRSIEFTTEGFFLNGKNLLLKGGCMHHDNGPLGAAAYDRAEERRVEMMKASGFNSIRCAHNPPSPAFLDACDRLGMLVIDEAFDMWRREKNPQDYHRFFDEWWMEDIKSMVLRDRNHPSVIMWSIGNEIPEKEEPEGAETSAMLAGFIHRLDPGRPVTSAVNELGPQNDPYFATLDICGYNYAFAGDHGINSIFRTDHKQHPDRIMYCAESYPLTAFGAWMDVVDIPYVIGDFVWTGFDYLGEASIGWMGYPHEGSFYPWNHAYCGDMDICGMKRPQSYYRDVLWKSGQLLSIFVKPPVPSFKENPNRESWSKWQWHDVVDCWDWKGYEDELLDVEVYCAYEEVELFLNGESLGRKETSRGTEWIARWKVPYEPGSLKAIAYKAGEQIDSWELVTASDPEKIQLKADRMAIRADCQDLSYVQVEIQDGEGNRNALADNLVEFELEGPGRIIAVANSNPMSAESYQQPRRKAYKGKCMAVIKSGREPGKLILTARSAELQPCSITITSEL